MNAQAIAIEFGDRLSRMRALSDEETDMLCAVMRHVPRAMRIRRVTWTAAEDRRLLKLARTKSHKQIAEQMGRTVWSVRKRIVRLKEKGRG